jgi:hypothetical protein
MASPLRKLSTTACGGRAKVDRIESKRQATLS